MPALLENPETVVPTDDDVQLATESSRILSREKFEIIDGGFSVRLTDGTELKLPKSAMRLMTHLLTEMSQGNAVTLIPIHANLTTQEAADYLGVSRPYLVNLLVRQEMPFHKVGTHRRIKFRDLMTYKDNQNRIHNEAMSELAAQAQELDLGY